jgi:hypothetical protein
MSLPHGGAFVRHVKMPCSAPVILELSQGTPTTLLYFASRGLMAEPEHATTLLGSEISPLHLSIRPNTRWHTAG